jgi:ferredoxin
VSAPIKIQADREICIGAGLCVMTAEDAFDQDDDGLVVLLTPHPGPEQAKKILKAVRSCPSGALSVES